LTSVAGQIDFYNRPKLITPATDAEASFCESANLKEPGPIPGVTL
jgi:hypothetical protein